MNQPLRTPAEARAELERLGISISQWAAANGFSVNMVFEVLSGRKKGIRGQAHNIAVKLGLKEGEVIDNKQAAIANALLTDHNDFGYPTTAAPLTPTPQPAMTWSVSQSLSGTAWRWRIDFPDGRYYYSLSYSTREQAENSLDQHLDGLTATALPLVPESQQPDQAAQPTDAVSSDTPAAPRCSSCGAFLPAVGDPVRDAFPTAPPDVARQRPAPALVPQES